MRHCVLHEVQKVEIKVVFFLKISCFLFARSCHLTLKGFNFHCLRAGAADINAKRLVSPSDFVGLAMRFKKNSLPDE